jgi:hypothetical protein
LETYRAGSQLNIYDILWILRCMREKLAGVVHILLALDSYASKVERDPRRYELLRSKIKEYLRMVQDGLAAELDTELDKYGEP